MLNKLLLIGLNVKVAHIVALDQAVQDKLASNKP